MFVELSFQLGNNGIGVTLNKFIVSWTFLLASSALIEAIYYYLGLEFIFSKLNSCLGLFPLLALIRISAMFAVLRNWLSFVFQVRPQ
jgi:hypothetical protein